MIICICEGLNDRTLREEIRRGASSVGQLARKCGAGTGCGLCACDLKQLILEEQQGGASDPEHDAMTRVAAK